MLAHHRKAVLPNYKVFDEKRYFTPGTEATVVDFDGFRLGLLICEDIWEPPPAAAAEALGAEAAADHQRLALRDPQAARARAVLGERMREAQLPAVYVNLLGGQDELVFDGNSFVMDAQGSVVMRAAAVRRKACTASSSSGARRRRWCRSRGRSRRSWLGRGRACIGALVLGVRDYVNKHGFPGVVMGLSGGVDSALTLAIAVDALGPERVHAVMMPSRYTSAMSREDAAAQARALGVSFSSISIEDMFEATLAALRERVRRPRARCHRGEHPGALPRRAADGDLQQDRPHAADHRQQERDGGRLRHPLRRHGRRLRADQGLQQAAGVSAGALPQYARRR